jgi:phosphate-selective porin OprO/OprP
LRRSLAAVALATAIMGGPAPLYAAEASRAELEERIRKLEDIIRRNGLDRPSAAKAPVQEPVTAPLESSQVEQIVDDKLRKQKVLAGWKDGFFLESPSGDFKLKLRGYVQSDARFFPLEEGDTGTDSFYLRRVRPIFEGTVYKYFDFRIMPDFGEGQTVLQDAYADITYWPYAKIRTGKFKEPLSLERLQSGQDLLFIERSLVQNLAPNRDVGLQIHGDLLGGAVTYQLGGFNGVRDGGSADGDTTSDKEVVGRVFGLPFKDTDIAPLKGLGLGVAGSFGGQKRGDDLGALRYRTASGRSAFFRYTVPSGGSVVAGGDRTRFAPQAYYYWGPFGLTGEYIWTQEGVLQRDGDGNATSADLINRAWSAQGSYVLTGEDASFKGVTPINPFDPRKGRWGAFEIAARGGQIRIDETAFSRGLASQGTSTREAIGYAFGVNWYFNRNFKFQVNWERTEFDEEVAFGDFDRDHEDVLLTRFQISY